MSRKGAAARLQEMTAATAHEPGRRQPALVAVLAGGAGRRMGGAKPAALLRGRPLVSYPVAAAQLAGLQVVVVAKAGSSLPALRCSIVHEPDLPHHPLCGIVAALVHARSPVLALGCDMPFISAEMIGWMARLPRAAVAAPSERPQPLAALWVPEQLPALRDALRRRAAMADLVAELSPETIGDEQLARFGDPELLFFNLNDQSDLARAERLAGSRIG